MAQVATVAPDQAVESKPGRGPIDWWGGHRLTFIGPLIFIVIAAHIPMFFRFHPFGTILTVGTSLHGRYWLPKVYGAAMGCPWSFFLLISAAVTEMMQVAMNEWGHSLWITEEIFAAPFHWPFVLYGWLAAGIFALWAETIIRLLGIEAEIEEAEATGGREAVVA